MAARGCSSDTAGAAAAAAAAMAVNFDEVLRQIGEFGKGQIILYILICLTGIPSGEQNLSSVFTGATQDHWCRVDQLQHLDPQLRRNLSIPVLPDGNFEKCQQYNCDYTQCNSISNCTCNRDANNTVSCNQWEYDTQAIQSTVNSQFNLVCDSSSISRLIVSIYMTGNLFGVLIGGMVSDRIGRVKTVAIVSGLHLIAGTVGALVPNLIVHMISRFFVAATSSAAFTSSFVYSMEVIGPKYRMATGIFVQGWFAYGFIQLAGIAYFVRNHIILQLILCAQAVVFIPYFFLFPESPRWLLSKGKTQEAATICSKIARLNGTKPVPDFEKLFNEETDEEQERKQEKSDMNEQHALQHPTPPKQLQQGILLDLLRRPRTRIRSLIIFFSWFAVSITYYGLSLNAEEIGGSIYFNTLISGLVELPSYALCCLLLNRFGRVRCMAASFLVGGVGCIAASFVSLVWLKVTMAMVGKFAISASFAIVYVYSAEVFPTVIRNIGVGAASMHARIGALLAPQIVELSVIWNPLPFTLIGLLSVLASVLSLLLPETLGQALPETLEEGEQFGLSKVSPEAPQLEKE